MSYLIILVISLIVISLYSNVAKNPAYQKMIETVSPSWNISINII